MEPQLQPDLTPSRLGKMLRIPVYLLLAYCFAIIIFVFGSIIYTIIFAEPMTRIENFQPPRETQRGIINESVTTKRVNETQLPQFIREEFSNGGAINMEVDETITRDSWECTGDCSGHEAGYEWAEEKGITDPSDCGGNSSAFIEGCEAYTNE